MEKARMTVSNKPEDICVPVYERDETPMMEFSLKDAEPLFKLTFPHNTNFFYYVTVRNGHRLRR